MAATNGTAGVGAGAGCLASGPGEKCSSTTPSIGNLGSGTQICIIISLVVLLHTY